MATELFPFLENLFRKSQVIDSKYDFKETYMAIKFLSLYPGTSDLANEANRLSCKLPGWAVNMFLFFSIPKQKPPHFQYPKKEESQKKWPKEAILKIAQKYCCSTEHAIQYLNILEKKDPGILESLGIPPEGEKKNGGKDRKLPKQKRKTG